MDFNRKELKTAAKQVLRKNYLIALLMSIVLCIAGATAYKSSNSGGGGESSSTIDFESLNIPTDEMGFPLPEYSFSDLLASIGITNPFVNQALGALSLATIVMVFWILILISFIISALFRLLIGFQLEIGARKAFLDLAEGRKTGFSRLSHGFTGGGYLNILVVMFMKGLFIFLWALLLIIPGIIKYYEYILISNLLADNPSLNRKRAFELSKAMTKGYKMKIFILRLSFIGWEILGALLFGIGQILVWPYIDETFAQLYVKMREAAIANGVTSYDELAVSPPEIQTIYEEDQAPQ